MAAKVLLGIRQEQLKQGCGDAVSSGCGSVDIDRVLADLVTKD